MPRFRPRLKFSLRTLLVLVTLLCVALGWLGYQLNWLRQRREARQWLSQNGRAYITPSHSIWKVIEADPPKAPLSLRIFGEDAVCFINLDLSNEDYSLENEKKLAELKRIFPEAKMIDNRYLD